MDAKHTQLPWKVAEYNGGFEIVTDSWDVASGSLGGRGPVRNAEDAAYIVRACNSHDALVEALKHARDEIASAPRSLGYAITALPKIDAALALALAGETP